MSQTTRKVPKHPQKDSELSLVSSIGLRPLPIEIDQIYSTPLPENHTLFRQALASANALDESDLQRWKVEPPFVEDDDMTDPHSAGYYHFTESLASVLHGIKLREQNQQDAQRRAEFDKEGQLVGMAALRTEVADLLSAWERVKVLSVYHEYHNPREYTMFQHYRQWQARTIYHLYHIKFLD
ncbi:hypothetical protein C8R44DRAFT_727228 [Mycena epipterygia]|nr:hypothetical protein C8R44DRAFT_727228 [Mycena epipterygia]